MFIHGHEKSNVVEDRKVFLEKIEKLKPYLVKFDENGTIKPKVYLSNCKVKGNNRGPILLITNDECTFSLNIGIRKAFAQKRNTFLRLKD